MGHGWADAAALPLSLSVVPTCVPNDSLGASGGTGRGPMGVTGVSSDRQPVLTWRRGERMVCASACKSSRRAHTQPPRGGGMVRRRLHARKDRACSLRCGRMARRMAVLLALSCRLGRERVRGPARPRTPNIHAHMSFVASVAILAYTKVAILPRWSLSIGDCRLRALAFVPPPWFAPSLHGLRREHLYR